MSSLSDFLGSASSSLQISGLPTGSSVINGVRAGLQGGLNTVASAILGDPSGTASPGASGGTVLGDDFAGMNRRGDAVLSWCWYCLLPDLTAAVPEPAGPTPIPISGQQGSVSLPWYYVQTSNLPWRQMGTDVVKRNGHDTHRPSGYSVGSLSLGLFMDSDNIAQQYIQAWQSLILANKNPKIAANQGAWGYPSTYMKDINLVVLSVTRRQLLNVRYINCWPSELGALELTSGESQVLVQNVTFMTEDVEVTVNNDRSLVDTLIASSSGLSSGSLAGGLNAAISSTLNNISIRL